MLILKVPVIQFILGVNLADQVVGRRIHLTATLAMHGVLTSVPLKKPTVTTDSYRLLCGGTDAMCIGLGSAPP